MDTLALSNAITELKNPAYEFNRRLHTAEETGKLKDQKKYVG